MGDYVGLKRGVQFLNSSDIDEPDTIEHVHIAATRQTLYEMGAYLFIAGARFPGRGQVTAPIKFNDTVAQQMMYIGLELMGAHELVFDVDWSTSGDGNYHAEFENDSANLGHWSLHLQHPIGSPAGFDDVTVTSVNCEADATANIVDNVLVLEIPRGCDGTDGTDGSNGTDGREVELRVDSGYIQWEYTSDDTWHNLISLSAITGAQGEQGEQGEQGIQGEQGEPGEKGDTGDTGFQAPPNTMTPGNDSRCAVAVACVEALYDMFTGALKFNSTQRSEVLGGSAGAGLIAGIIFPGLGAIIASGVAIAALYNTLLDIEANGLIPYFDTTIKEELRDQLYCVLEEDAQYNSTVQANWINKIENTSDSLHDYMVTVMNLAGTIPFEWAATSAPLLATPDCSSADCDNDINVTYPEGYQGDNPNSIRSGYNATFTFNDRGGANGFCRIRLDQCCSIEVIGFTGASTGSSPVAYTWENCVPEFVEGLTTYEDLEESMGFSAWNDIIGATITIKCTIIP